MKLILLISMAMILSACATSGKSDYMSMELKYSTEAKNINFENSIPIEMERLEAVGLINEDPLFKFNGYVSHYKVLKVKVDAAQKYKIDLWSVCDCFIPKKIINPIFEIYTAKGLVVQNKILESKVEDVNWEIKRSLSIHNIYEFESAQEQYIYFVLAANNENVGKPLTSIKTNAYAPGVEIPLSINVISHPVGSFELVFSKNN